MNCAIVLGFAANYSFKIQYAAHSFHFNNSQVRIHPFEIHHQDAESGFIVHAQMQCLYHLYDLFQC